ncbi:MAG: DUF3179 domain-containing protein [Rhodospirillaceae bacterium]|nr:DUF3179 domain-containing protein [Rhodospirillaceae bacterium]
MRTLALSALSLPALALAGALALQPAAAREAPSGWLYEWGSTDFSKSSISFDEIMSGGPPKDGIPAIDDPVFVAASDLEDLAGTEPVISFVVGDDHRAYPLQVLIWHEIVNDTVGGVPISVTFCPLCNSAVVYDRRVGDAVLDFGTTGKLRNSDLVMYDRQTESWWQQFTGEGIVGAYTGTALKRLPSRLESFARFQERVGSDGKVLVPSRAGARAYGMNPYSSYDSSSRPFLYNGDLPEGIEPLARVVVVEDEAWSLQLIRDAGRYERGDLVITWEAGQNSALDSRRIAKGRDVGNVIVQRTGGDGSLEDVPYDIAFAFAFHAFHPEALIHTTAQ